MKCPGKFKFSHTAEGSTLKRGGTGPQSPTGKGAFSALYPRAEGDQRQVLAWGAAHPLFAFGKLVKCMEPRFHLIRFTFPRWIPLYQQFWQTPECFV